MRQILRKLLRLGKGPAAPQPVEIRAYTAMDDEEMYKALAAAPARLLRAIEQITDETFVAASQAALGADLTGDARAYHVGGSDYVLRVKRRLQEELEAAKSWERTTEDPAG